ncbi:hypothetical protein [Fibrobacter sp. UWEL]|uniref:hypothetical protein n=1 Tax=Fibrobacter sp. UWEL TaxID=1896209 RepID=UPI00091D65FD|nr:hypothetical protein [Fibrobacter sp. UWEL]SHK47745.1 hypothetical protein SAMN05720468_102180 [Fibrobacter sp. UWEL]
MKKIILFSALSILAAAFTACGDKSSTNFIGYWQESESNIVFEVLQNDQNFIIRNQNGDLFAQVTSDRKLCGKNTLNMDYCMTVKGDSAYYEFSGIVTGYKRIDQATYEKIFATLPKATFTAPVEEAPAEDAAN